MARSIPAAYAEIVAQISTIEGMRNVPDFPLENPATFTYFEMGQVEAEYNGLTFGQPIGVVKFPFKIHVARKGDLPREMAVLLPFAERLANLLMYGANYKNLNNTVNGVDSLTCKMTPAAAGDQDTIAWDCVLTCQIYAGPSA